MKAVAAAIIASAAAALAQDLPLGKLKPLLPEAQSFKASIKTNESGKATFYIGATKNPTGGKTPVGIIWLGEATCPKGPVALGIAVSPDARVMRVKLFGQNAGPLASPEFLAQFEGKAAPADTDPSDDEANARMLAFLKKQRGFMEELDDAETKITGLIKRKQAGDATAAKAIAGQFAEYMEFLKTVDDGLDPAIAQIKNYASATAPIAAAFPVKIKGDALALEDAYDDLAKSCDKCHANLQTPLKKLRKHLAASRGSPFVVGQDLKTAAAGEDAASQAVADAVKNAAAMITAVYRLK